MSDQQPEHDDHVEGEDYDFVPEVDDEDDDDAEGDGEDEGAPE